MATLCSALFNSDAQAGSRKVALIIANAHYANTSTLKNPTSDAAIIADALHADNFAVVNMQTDLDVSHLRNQLKQFADQAKDADVALIYYAGHGILDSGINWLIPVDATLKSEADLDLEAVNLDSLSFAIQDAKVRVVIIDACRDNPFRRGWVSPTRGLVPAGLGAVQLDGQLVIFSAAPGQEAQDGMGTNSPFAQALARRLVQPDLPVQLLGNAVRDDVISSTGNRQRPFFNASMSVTLAYLSEQSYPVASAAGGQKTDTNTLDALSWQGALRADTLEAYVAYRDNNPNGYFVKLAAANIKRLGTVQLAGQMASEAAAGTRVFSAQKDHEATGQLNAFIKRQVDIRDNAQESAMNDYRAQLAELARTTAAMRQEYTRKIENFREQQGKYEADQKEWLDRVEACKHENVKVCAKSAQAPAATVAMPSFIWKEALIACREPSGNRETTSDCQGPAGRGTAVLGTGSGEKLLSKLCDDVPNYRDLGVVQGIRVYGCGFGLNPSLPIAKKGNLDVAATLDLTALPGRLNYHCADLSTRICRSRADDPQ